jgi:hypothetical protein
MVLARIGGCEQLPAHPELDDERAAVARDDGEALAASLEPFDACAVEELARRHPRASLAGTAASLAARAHVVRADAADGERPALDQRREGAADHLDFREFRQGAELYFSHERTRRIDGRPHAC